MAMPTEVTQLPQDEIIDAVIVEDEPIPSVRSSWPTRLLRFVGKGFNWLFGLASLVILLAVLATVPILQLLSLGFLLEASGRVAKSGRIRDGLLGIRQAAKLGSIVAGTWISLLPAQYVSEVWYAANLIDATSPMTGVLRVVQLVVTALVIGHILAAWYCGGRLRHFLWPLIAPVQFFFWSARYLASRRRFRQIFDHTLGLISPRLVQDICDWKPLSDWFVPAILLKACHRGRMFTNARDAVCDFVIGLRLSHYFWLGLRGFIGGVIWLVVPVIFLAGVTTLPPGPAVISALIGTVLLVFVVLYLPFLQTRFVLENRFGALLEVREIRRMFLRAPVAFLVALFITLLLAVPLYLLKIEPIFAELMWLPTIPFVIFMLPARLLIGWAVSRANRRATPRFAPVRWLSRAATLVVVLVYALIVLVSPYVAWDGTWNMLEQHAFLVPVPFLGL